MSQENRVTFWTLAGICALFGAAWALGTIGIGDAAELIAWKTDPGLVDDTGGSGDKLTFVEFTAPGCPPCHRMAREVFSESVVAEALAPFVPVRLDLSDPEANKRAVRFGIPGVPTFLILHPDGRVLRSRSGYVAVGEFLEFLHGARVDYENSKRADSKRADSKRADSGQDG